MIRVLIVEDQTLISAALSALLRLEGDIDVVAIAQDGETALALCREHAPHVLIADVEMPGMNGIELAARVKQLDTRSRIIMLSAFARVGYLQRAIAAGASAFVSKDAPAEHLADTIRRVHQGLRVFDAELAADALHAINPLNAREQAVLRLVGEGVESQEIGKRLQLSSGTVRNYTSAALEKLGASTRIEAFNLARDKGWL